MVKGKRNGLTFTECLVKICRFLLLPPSFRKWSYHNTTQSECAHRLVQTFSLVMSRPKCPASLSKWQAFSDLLLLVSAVNPSFKLTVFMAYEKQHTIFQNELLDFLTWISFLIFEKIDEILVIAEIVKNFVVRFRFCHRWRKESREYWESRINPFCSVRSKWISLWSTQ